jgi:hypothetical protein
MVWRERQRVLKDAPEDPGARAYDRVVDGLVGMGAQKGQMMGMPCAKIGGKMFAGYYAGDMTFKLAGEDRERALALPGARLFDPSGAGRPMKAWVQVPATSAEAWQELGEAALRGVLPGQ